LRRRQPTGQRIINGGESFAQERLVQLCLGFLVIARLFLPDWAATSLLLRIAVAGLLDDAQQVLTAISRE
jgi:hypothetical protein